MTRASDEVEPGSSSQATPGRRTRLWRAAPLGVALACLLVSAWSVRDLGLTTDEPRYIDNSQRIHAWFGDLFGQGPGAAFAEDRLAEGWYYARPESKNLPLVSLVGSLGRFTFGLFDSPPHSYRWGNLVVLAVTCGVVFSWVRDELSAPAAIIAVAAMVGMPRLWAHALLMSIDPLVASFQVLACWALWKCRQDTELQTRSAWWWPVVFGLLAGVGAMAKPTFWLIVPAWAAWGILTGPRRSWRAAVCLITVAPLAALILMPPWWSNPIGGFLGYIDLLLNDPVGWKIDAYYLGHVFQAELVPGARPVPVPWHSVPLLSIITTPLWIVVLVLVEMTGWLLSLLAHGLARRAGSDRTTPAGPGMALEGLWLIAAVVLPLVVMLPNTPAHDGTRLYRPAFYFAAFLAAGGFERLRLRWVGNNRPRITWTTAAVLASVAVGTNATIHPAGLSYYNSLVGGFAEATRPVPLGHSLPEPKRPLHEVSYWWELFNREAIDQMQEHLPRGARLTFFPEHYGKQMLRQWGHLRDDVQLVGTNEADYMVMYARMGRLMDPRAHPSGSRFLHGAAEWEWTVHGVRTIVLVRVNLPGPSSDTP